MSRGVNRKPWCEQEGGVLYIEEDGAGRLLVALVTRRPDLPMEERSPDGGALGETTSVPWASGVRVRGTSPCRSDPIR